MPRYRVKCVAKSPPGNHPSLVTHLGNQIDYPAWRYSCEQVIGMIESWEATFFIEDPAERGRELNLRVVRPGRPEEGSPYLRPYVRTTPENHPNDPLLALPTCR